MLGVMDGIGEGSPYSEIYRASFTEPVTVGEPEDEDNSVPGDIVIGDDDITVADDEADTDETTMTELQTIRTTAVISILPTLPTTLPPPLQTATPMEIRRRAAHFLSVSRRFPYSLRRCL